MAVGDVIVSVSDAGATGFRTFQPASGVEIMITFVSPGVGGGVHTGLSNGVQTSYSGNPSGNYYAAFKLGITNTTYLNQYSDTNIASYSGIQTK